MKLGFFGAIAPLVTCVLAVACGGTEDSRDYRVADAGTSESIVDAGAKKDASQISSGGDSDGGVIEQGGGTGGGGSGAGSGTCAPAAACDGLYYCTDACYTDRCCDLVCSCSDPNGLSGNLECELTNCRN